MARVGRMLAGITVARHFRGPVSQDALGDAVDVGAMAFQRMAFAELATSLSMYSLCIAGIG